ncbi:NAD(P)H dehydrogenase (quinone) [Paraburkholderia youngii]
MFGIHFQYTSAMTIVTVFSHEGLVMNVLIIYAHPEPKSLNGSLKDFAVRHLERAGHTVQVSDLYAMNWKASLDAHDTSERHSAERFFASLESKHAFENGLQREDIAREQDKLKWADAVILQFPLWWFSMPAIMKGWVERVYAYGLAYGVGEHSDARWGERYGEGRFAGKRAMLVVTTGGWESHYSARGINGPIDDVLFPIQHGVLYYPGFDVLPPFVVYRTSRVDDAKYAEVSAALGRRLDTLWTSAPIAFRPQNGGAYEIPALTLRDDLAPGQVGFAVHVEDVGAASATQANEAAEA